MEEKFSGGVKTTLEVGDTADINKTHGQSGNKAECDICGGGVDGGEGGRSVRDNTTIAKFE